MGASDFLLLLIAAALIPFAGLIASMDSAVLQVSVARVEELENDGARGAGALAAIVVDRARYTNLLLLLRVVAELTATVMTTIALRQQLGGGWLVAALTIIIMTIVCYVLVGVGPRTIGRQHPYRIALLGALPLRILGRLVSPLASLLILIGNAITPGRGLREGPFSSEVELRELVDLAEARGVVQSEEREMIQSVFELGDTTARDVMVPRNDVVWIESDRTVAKALALALRSGFSRLPVIGDNIDDVIGVVYLKDLVARAQSGERGEGVVVSAIMRAPSFVPESKPIDDLLREMQTRRTHIDVVIDEYGGTAGLVTIEDILEEIVGEITDEYDHERPPVDWIDKDSARVTARLLVEDLAELFEVELPDEDDDAETVGGLLAQEIGRVPIVGSSAEVSGLLLIAENVGGRRNRIDTVLVRRVTAPDPSEAARVDDTARTGSTRIGAEGAP
jgi:CBS domain containing-hemolysin-like protein